jgi:hypothetical protein
MAADIRVASLLSEDEELQNSFIKSDPYTNMLEYGYFENRDQCKLFLLKSINSLNISIELMKIYPKLCKWLDLCSGITRMSDGYLESLLGKKFKVETAKNGLAVLNGAMQGSIAHAMHNVLRQAWDLYPTYVCAEIHDSIVLSVPRDPIVIKSVIADISNIMVRPFAGYLDYNPFFPVRVSVGSKWKQWNLIQIIRESGVTHVKKK